MTRPLSEQMTRLARSIDDRAAAADPLSCQELRRLSTRLLMAAADIVRLEIGTIALDLDALDRELELEVRALPANVVPLWTSRCGRHVVVPIRTPDDGGAA